MSHTLTCYSQSSFQALPVIYHVSNVNGVLQYTRITALYITSVNFLAVENNYLQDQIPGMLVSDFEIIITKPFPAVPLLSPFGFYGDSLYYVVVWRHGQRQEQKACYKY